MPGFHSGRPKCEAVSALHHGNPPPAKTANAQQCSLQSTPGEARKTFPWPFSCQHDVITIGSVEGSSPHKRHDAIVAQPSFGAARAGPVTKLNFAGNIVAQREARFRNGRNGS
jgi:hypothetical protein